MKQSGFRLMLFFVMLAAVAVTPRVHATAIANGSLQLQSLTITPAQGSILFSPTASSFASAQNSLGEFDDSFDSGSIATSSATVTWANAGVLMDSISHTGFVAANSQIPAGVVGASNSFALGSFSDFSFSVTGTTGQVPVEFSAILPYMQSLMTDTSGTAGSGIDFLLSLDGATVLDSQSAYSIGPDSTLNTSGTWNLNNSIMLTADQTYSVHVTLLSVSTTASVPEPATVCLFLTGGILPMILWRWHSRVTQPSR